MWFIFISASTDQGSHKADIWRLPPQSPHLLQQRLLWSRVQCPERNHWQQFQCATTQPAMVRDWNRHHQDCAQRHTFHSKVGPLASRQLLFIITQLWTIILHLHFGTQLSIGMFLFNLSCTGLLTQISCASFSLLFLLHSSRSCCWIPTASRFNSWTFLHPVDLGTRSDTAKPNRPPLVSVLPFIR